MKESREAYIVEIEPGRFYTMTNRRGQLRTSPTLASAHFFDNPVDACGISLVAKMRGKTKCRCRKVKV